METRLRHLAGYLIFNEGTDDADFTVLRDYTVKTVLIYVIRAFILSNL